MGPLVFRICLLIIINIVSRPPAIDMITRLANSERVEQVFVRHAFRYWMGRNETINDAPILQEAHKAYKESGGSMQALITSLVTSDAFLYRKVDRRGGAR